MSNERCNAEHEPSGAHCHKAPHTTGRHNAYTHYPGQVVSWDQESGEA